MLGRDPGDHADLVDPPQRLGIAHRPELGPGDHLPLDAQLPRDRARGDRVVAGDHPDPDPGRLRGRDGSLAVGRGGSTIPTSDSSSRPSTSGEQVGVGVEGGRVEVLAGGGQHPQALLAEPLVLRQVALPELAVGGHRPRVGVEDRRGPRE